MALVNYCEFAGGEVIINLDIDDATQEVTAIVYTNRTGRDGYIDFVAQSGQAAKRIVVSANSADVRVRLSGFTANLSRGSGQQIMMGWPI